MYRYSNIYNYIGYLMSEKVTGNLAGIRKYEKR